MQDVWGGKVRAGQVLRLVEHLKFNPHSRVRMIHLGGDQRWIGWDATAEAVAHTHDAILSFAAGIGGESLTPDQLYPRPGKKPGTEQPAAKETGLFAETVDDFDVGAFMKAIYGG